jgi:hypothetical protein
MAWKEGNQKRKAQFRKVNEEILSKKGFLEEREAKILLYKFLRANISFSSEMICGVKLFPFQHLAIKTMFETDYSMMVWSRGLSKSFTCAVFASLDAILNQGVHVGIVSKTFRQAKMIFKKIEEIAEKPQAVFLKQCITKVTKSSDEWTMEIGRSKITCLPLGDGEKLRGFRFHRMMIDEFLLMPERIFNEVIIPFLSVVQNPTERKQVYDLETELIKRGEMTEEDRFKWPNNKIIVLSSASYQFEYMYKLYKRYENLIESPEKDGKGGATRAILHFSYDIAPHGLYDESLLTQAKSTMSESQFKREFGSQFVDDSSGYFKLSKMHECTVKAGEGQCIELAGEKNAEYILSFDPSWAETDSSDDFAMNLIKLDKGGRKGILVHNYAVSGTNLRKHIEYLHYLLTNFNVVAMCGDYNGGLQFINAANESDLFKEAKLNVKIFEGDFDSPESYQDEMRKARNSYNRSTNKICYLRVPTSGWIRYANELLQSNFDHRKILFAAEAIDDDFTAQKSKSIPIKNLKFFRDQEDGQGVEAKMVDFVDHQADLIELVKAQCSLIMPTTTTNGHQSFDLPVELKKQNGAEKTRKDSYSCLILGNWMTKIYFDMMEAKVESVQSTFTPFFAR